LANHISGNAVQTLKIGFIGTYTPSKLSSHVISSAKGQDSELNQRQVYFASQLYEQVCKRAITAQDHQNDSGHALPYSVKGYLLLLFVYNIEDMATCF